MSEKLVYSKTRSHWDNDNDWIPEPGNGKDSHKFDIPDGSKFTRYAIELLTPPVASGYQVLAAPKSGASGKQKITVSYYYTPFGKVSYRLKVYAGKPTPVDILFGTDHWFNHVRDAVDQGVPIKLLVRGPQARELYRALLMPTDEKPPADLFRTWDAPEFDIDRDVVHDTTAPLAEPVIAITITIALVTGVVVVAGFATLGSVLLYAMHKGYKAKGVYKVINDLLGKFEFGIDLTPPS